MGGEGPPGVMGGGRREGGGRRRVGIFNLFLVGV